MRKQHSFLLLMAVLVISLLATFANTALAQRRSGNFVVRGSLGTDIELGLGFGGGVSYILSPSRGGTAFEFSADLFFHNSSGNETEPDGVIMTSTKWDLSLMVFGVKANTLFNYYPRKSGVYFIAGFGFVVGSVDYKEDWGGQSADGYFSYPTEHNTVDGTSVGNVINLGLGIMLGNGVEMRFETPMLFFYSSVGNTSFVPTGTLGIQYRFN